MKFDFTPRFRRDFNNLEAREQRAVTNARTSIKLALEGNVQYFNAHHIKRMEGHPKIWGVAKRMG